MRTVGCILVLLSCLAVGLTCTGVQRRRIRTLRELCYALSLMEGEMTDRLRPIPELADMLSGQTGGQTGAFFRQLSDSMDRLGDEPFADLWRGATAGLSALREEERQELCRLGPVLGQYELDRQINALRLCRSALDAALQTARENYPGEKRLYLGLPSALGALIVITLL